MLGTHLAGLRCTPGTPLLPPVAGGCCGLAPLPLPVAGGGGGVDVLPLVAGGSGNVLELLAPDWALAACTGGKDLAARPPFLGIGGAAMSDFANAPDWELAAVETGRITAGVADEADLLDAEAVSLCRASFSLFITSLAASRILTLNKARVPRAPAAFEATSAVVGFVLS